MPRYKLTLEYDGRRYFGWQRQREQVSVQEVLEKALAKLTNGIPVAAFCAGRTDAGVHATAQVVHIDMPKAYGLHNIVMGTNFHLTGESVIVLAAEEVTEAFHARFSATGRAYTYRIINRTARLALDDGRAWHVPETLDVNAMREGARILVGTHDFTSFRATECQSKSPIKTLDRLDVERVGNEIRVHTASRSFLHHQVRNMVGTLRLCGNGKWLPSDVQAALEARDRRAGGETAPPDGLYLIRVDY